jgi:hypothetical protein
MKRPRHFDIPTSRGGYPFPVTSHRRDGYGCTGVPPIASRIVIAIGQLPTDSFGAVAVLTAQASGVLGCLVVGPAPRGEVAAHRTSGFGRVPSRSPVVTASTWDAVSSRLRPIKQRCELKQLERLSPHGSFVGS